jgi:serine/threonine-protein kinase
VHALAGRWQDALAPLETATRTLNRLSSGVTHVRAYLWLGRTKEALGDTAGACEAYAHVVSDWGAARPRSTTADAARARRASLHCR